MNKLVEFNKYALNELKCLDSEKELTNPLLTSPLVNAKTMYIGQECNGWYGSFMDNNYTCEQLEEHYKKFFINGTTNNKPYWKFIKSVTEKIYLSNDITWTNLILSGKNGSLGNPNCSDKIKKLSVENLLAIYEYINAEKIICVGGPCNPYYSFFTSFLDEIGKTISTYPTRSNPIVYSDDEKVLWTYHPQSLIRQHLYGEVLVKTKEFYNKK